MCNINLIYCKKKHKKEYNELLNIMTYASFLENDDGEGFFCIDDNNKVSMLKSKHKLIYNLKNKFKLIATHQRYTTSGEGIENTHPHETEDLIIIHNGVLSNLAEGKKSDTKVYAEKLQDAYIKNNKDLIKAIQELNKSLNGSYSIVVYDKNNKQVLYFKEQNTKMFCIENDEILIMTTKKENVEYSKAYLNIETDIKEFKPLKIYDVMNDFKELGTFEEKPYISYSTFKHKSKNCISTKKAQRNEIIRILKEKFNSTLQGYDEDNYLITTPMQDLNDVYAYFDNIDVIRACEKSLILKIKHNDVLFMLEEFKKPLDVTTYLNEQYYKPQYKEDMTDDFRSQYDEQQFLFKLRQDYEY